VPLETQAGVKDEVTYGTAVTVDRFFEYTSENIKRNQVRIDPVLLRTGQMVQRNNRWVPINKGASGPIKFPVLSVGYGWWLKHKLGTVSTGATADSVTPHTGTMGSLLGDAFTFQANRYDDVTGTNRAFTWEGGKVASWELANSVDGILECTINADFENEETGTALASASYPAGGELFSWAGGVVELATVATNVTNIKVAVDNGLKLDRHAIRGNTQKLQPLQTKHRKVTWEIECYWESMTQYNRFASATAAGALALLKGTWTAPTLVGAATYPKLELTVDEARFDSAEPFVTGEDMIMQKLSGIGMWDGSASPVTEVYTTADTTP
jgi:hypothetical protein